MKIQFVHLLDVLAKFLLLCTLFFLSGAARDGAYIHGLFMEGARWDIMQGVIMESKLKELFPQMPVINVRVSTY